MYIYKCVYIIHMDTQKFITAQAYISLMSVLCQLDTAVINMENKRYVCHHEDYNTVGEEINNSWPDMLYHEKYHAAQLPANETSFRWGG